MRYIEEQEPPEVVSTTPLDRPTTLFHIYQTIHHVLGTDVASLMEESKLLVLLSKIQQKTNDTEEYLRVLTNAREVQIRLSILFMTYTVSFLSHL